MKDLTALIPRYTGRIEQVLRNSCATVGTNVSVRTPVDTGTLRASWTPGLNRLGAANAGGNIFAAAQKMQLGDDYYLVNSQPYGPAIEYLGHSNQAPSGMLRVSVAEWPGIVAREVSRAS